MGEKLYHLVIDGEEQGLVLHGLEALKEEIKNCEDMEDSVNAINEIMVKIAKSPTKKFKVVERDN